MTLDEAIKHCEEKAKELRAEVDVYKNAWKDSEKEQADCLECAEEHEQLAEWLKELKTYKEASKGDLISRTELKKCAIPCEIHNGALTDLCVPLYQIDNAPTIKDRSLEIAQKSIELGRKVGQLEGKLERPHGEWVRKEDVIHSIAKQYSEHNELVPIWLSIGDKKGGAE